MAARCHFELEILESSFKESTLVLSEVCVLSRFFDAGIIYAKNIVYFIF